MFNSEVSDNQAVATFRERQLETNERLLNSLSERFSISSASDFATLVRPSDRQEPAQRLFHYREGYTLELCRRLMAEDRGPILDPFCGFGSTLLAAKERGIRSIGFDVNPLAISVSRAKTVNYASSDLAALSRLKADLSRLSSTAEAAQSPALRIINKLFHPEILLALNVFKHRILGIENSKAKKLALICWLSCLEDVSNVFREGNGVKYRYRLRRGNEYTTLPYEEWAESYFPPDKFGYVRDVLLQRLGTAIADFDRDSALVEPDIIEADSMELGRHIADDSIGLALFSPPYCNLFNYIKAYKLELWMGGFIGEYADVRRLTARGIRSRLEGLRPSSGEAGSEVERFASLIEQGETWSVSLPDVVRGYFGDMQNVLKAIYRSLAPGGRTVIVVGNSALGGVLIPTDMLLASIAETIGFEVSSLGVARHLTTSSQQKKSLDLFKGYMRETIIELRK